MRADMAAGVVEHIRGFGCLQQKRAATAALLFRI